jgi:hypothetical protein
MPKRAAQGGFQGIDQPGEIRVGIADFQHRHLDRNPAALVQSLDFNRQVS